jgi:hypothetical protein
VYRGNHVAGWNVGFDLNVAGVASELVVEGNDMRRLSGGSAQNATPAGWTGPVTRGLGMSAVIRNNTIDGAPLL